MTLGVVISEGIIIELWRDFQGIPTARLLQTMFIEAVLLGGENDSSFATKIGLTRSLGDLNHAKWWEPKTEHAHVMHMTSFLR